MLWLHCIDTVSICSPSHVCSSLFFRCDSPEKLKALLPRLEQELKDSGKFKDFYQFTFNFAKNPGQKGLGKKNDSSDNNVSMMVLRLQCSLYSLFLCADLEMAVAYWNLVLSGRFKFLDLWNRFLLVSRHRENRDLATRMLELVWKLYLLSQCLDCLSHLQMEQHVYDWVQE